MFTVPDMDGVPTTVTAPEMEGVPPKVTGVSPIMEAPTVPETEPVGRESILTTGYSTPPIVEEAAVFTDA